MIRTLLLIQGFYFLLMGLWPLISITTFLKVTGPKTDLWLVKAFGVLTASVGVPLLLASWSSDQSLSIALLGVLTAAALAAVDMYYVAKGTIARSYLIDAAIEACLIVGWSIVMLS